MPEPDRPLLAELRDEIASLVAELREMLILRWQLARLELRTDLGSILRLAAVLVLVLLMALTALPLLAVSLAALLDGCLGLSAAGWLAAFGFGLLAVGGLAGYAAWRRFRNRFIGLEQTLEELQEDAVWVREWQGRDD